MIDRAEKQRLAGELRALRRQLHGVSPPPAPRSRRWPLRAGAAALAAAVAAAAALGGRDRPAAALPVDAAAGLAADGRILYVADSQRKLLFGLDRGSLKVASIRPLPAGEVAGLAVSASAAWTSDGSGRITRHDLADRAAGASRALDMPGARLGALAWDGATLWASDRASQSVLRLRPSGEALQTAGFHPLPGVTPAALSIKGDTLYALDEASRVLRSYRMGGSLEPVSSTNLASALPPGVRATGLLVEGREAWVVTQVPPGLHRLRLNAGFR